MEKIHKIIENFENNNPQNWKHYEHLIICMYYAFRADTHNTLFAQMRCGLIRYRALTDEKSTLTSCTSKYNDTRTWFWSILLFAIVHEHKEKTIFEILDIAESRGYFKSEYILNYYSKEELENPENKIFALKKNIL